MTDPTEETLESLRAVNAELSAFTRRLAHDMGAPLRTIQGFTEVLMLTARPQLSGAALDQLEKLGAAATRVDAMVRSLSQYARIGPTSPPAEPTDLTELALETWQLVVGDANQAGTHLEVEELPCVAVAEPPLRSVFLNLFDNAVRYASATSPRVTVSASSQSGGLVRISVVDTGPGIADEMVEWALAPASAGDMTAATAGMGLAIARAHVEAHGGKLGIEPNAPHGTRVWFTLPRN